MRLIGGGSRRRIDEPDAAALSSTRVDRSQAVQTGAREPARIVRHALADRVFHWVSAACVLTLLGTAFLPIVGFRFPWVTAHWITGLVLIVAVLFHTVRALVWQDLRSMWIGRSDLRDALGILRWTLRTGDPPAKPGKYSLAQKLIHHLFALAVVTTMITGALMLAKIDTPWWRRNPYWLADGTWGVVYVLHGFASLALITMVMAHIYFAFRPEKLKFTRAMVFGWITRQEYDEHHDPTRWQANQ
jgi:cytochrome b subunit of formate dehydrogenase